MKVGSCDVFFVYWTEWYHFSGNTSGIDETEGNFHLQQSHLFSVRLREISAPTPLRHLLSLISQPCVISMLYNMHVLLSKKYMIGMWDITWIFHREGSRCKQHLWYKNQETIPVKDTNYCTWYDLHRHFTWFLASWNYHANQTSWDMSSISHGHDILLNIKWLVLTVCSVQVAAVVVSVAHGSVEVSVGNPLTPACTPPGGVTRQDSPTCR